MGVGRALSGTILKNGRIRGTSEQRRITKYFLNNLIGGEGSTIRYLNPLIPVILLTSLTLFIPLSPIPTPYPPLIPPTPLIHPSPFIHLFPLTLLNFFPHRNPLTLHALPLLVPLKSYLSQLSHL